ncbi:MAG: cobyrinate a,c-diamide synthase [Deltaproteobacteria bacterium]|nr:MAG: cobyrinate a,c-diamide synthase [Deltaproteobacteria bacterium]
MKYAFCIAGTHSGCGKTTVTLGIMAALVRRGMRVQPFKVGPDFIDPGHHRRITGRDSHNLDGWMLTKETNIGLFQRYASDSDVAILEGVMGLFDGLSGKDEVASTAQMAKWLGIPVILVIDARAMARSAAAMASGYYHFDPDLSLIGVIFNRVGSDSHASMLQDAMQDAGLKVYGCLPRNRDVMIPSRHLGLVTEQDMEQDAKAIERFSSWIEDHVNLDELLHDTRLQKDYPLSKGWGPCRHEEGQVKIGIAQDRAFCFYYPENLRLLTEAGAQLIPFSPLHDPSLPEGIKGLYLGGGYPELYSSQLSQNTSLLREIKEFALEGGPIYAECGGFMYLMEEIQTIEGDYFPMCGVFNMRAKMELSLKVLGYREVVIGKDVIIGPKGARLRGHEYHYSFVQGWYGDTEQVYDISEQAAGRAKCEGFLFKNTLASYVHLYWASNRNVARHFVNFCKQYGP